MPKSSPTDAKTLPLKQYQHGTPLPLIPTTADLQVAFDDLFPSPDACIAALYNAICTNGFTCIKCQHREGRLLGTDGVECLECRTRIPLTAISGFRRLPISPERLLRACWSVLFHEHAITKIEVLELLGGDTTLLKPFLTRLANILQFAEREKLSAQAIEVVFTGWAEMNGVAEDEIAARNTNILFVVARSQFSGVDRLRILRVSDEFPRDWEAEMTKVMSDPVDGFPTVYTHWTDPAEENADALFPANGQFFHVAAVTEEEVRQHLGHATTALNALADWAQQAYPVAEWSQEIGLVLAHLVFRYNRYIRYAKKQRYRNVEAPPRRSAPPAKVFSEFLAAGMHMRFWSQYWKAKTIAAR